MAEWLDVNPEQIRAGAPRVYDAADQVGDAAALLRGLEVAPQLFGDVAAAGEFARAVAEVAHAHSLDLAKGSTWVNAAADAMKAGADAYQRRDDEHVTRLRALMGEG